MSTDQIWKPGESGNPKGRPKGTSKPVSKLRSLVRKLQEMEPKALENIKNSIEGKEVDKATLDTSKWVITTAVSVNRAATQEEQLKHEIRRDAEEKKEEEKKEGTTGNVLRPRFRTKMVNEEVDEEE